ncbi:phenylalanine--tRNA ligase subunit alpha [Hydrogenothermus marinus]|uniref:Phenylalanine--tRNA ligase alpha subunit n=1 Tax=Hydrogenothermus marinus TaxID=133270 RepID=A0A3M0BAJ7_9AQUI|nr:phenylalanine--tRNA ligase subunit alpha [Hydrogenothermus marinus]RMA93199.1 phenylalanyl-tRNA synthetase alpha subunit [Hydrogenothermus marinus]
MDIKKQLKALEEEYKQKIKEVLSLEELQKVKSTLLGKKGKITSFLKQLKSLTPEQKKEFGKAINEVKNLFEDLIKEKETELKEKALEEKLKKSQIDITLPAEWTEAGAPHPTTYTLKYITDIFVSMGFSIEEGPEVELEEYNFDMLNIPKDHPARDMQDTFFINKEGYVLRTHTSPVQIRTMLKKKPPLAVVAPGKVYRKDLDPTHSPMFHQIEGLFVDKNVSFRDLKGILKIFLETVFGKDIPIRFRPSYFPFTEPSAEVDIGCTVCKGKGCRVCKGTGWLEILGCGMVDPNVFKAVGINPEEFSGFAFGLGIERIAMLKFQIPDIRLLFNNDMRFNLQFKGL